MTTQSMGKIMDAYVSDLEGQPGFWRGMRAEVPVFVHTDEEHDRMRIMAPIGVIEELDAELLHVLLQANFNRALDARYAMHGRDLWALVVHPLTTLAPDDLPSLFDQVVALVKNTGSSFASTELEFRSFPGQDIVLETGDDDDDDASGEDDDESPDDGDDEANGAEGNGGRSPER